MPQGVDPCKVPPFTLRLRSALGLLYARINSKYPRDVVSIRGRDQLEKVVDVKSLPPGTGVIYGLYCTCHPEAGIRYVGQTVSLPRRRLNSHLSAARRKKVRGERLWRSQAWILKHGSENIRISVIESAHVEELDPREEFWISIIPNLTNAKPGGSNSRGWKHTEESKRKISESKIGKTRFLTEEWKRRIGESQMGKTISPETRRKISVAKMGCVYSEEAKAKRRSTILANSTFAGEGNGRAKLTETAVIDIRSGDLSYWELSEKYGVSYGSIYRVAIGKTWTHVR